jgi:hypothetical protein
MHTPYICYFQKRPSPYCMHVHGVCNRCALTDDQTPPATALAWMANILSCCPAGELPEETREDYEQAIALVRSLVLGRPPCGLQAAVLWLRSACPCHGQWGADLDEKRRGACCAGRRLCRGRHSADQGRPPGSAPRGDVLMLHFLQNICRHAMRWCYEVVVTRQLCQSAPDFLQPNLSNTTNADDLFKDRTSECDKTRAAGRPSGSSVSSLASHGHLPARLGNCCAMCAPQRHM